MYPLGAIKLKSKFLSRKDVIDAVLYYDESCRGCYAKIYGKCKWGMLQMVVVLEDESLNDLHEMYAILNDFYEKADKDIMVDVFFASKGDYENIIAPNIPEQPVLQKDTSK